MYIKKVIKRNKNSSKKYEYLHLVENIRTENGPRQRLILNLGKIDIPKEKYKELANYIEAVLTGQQELFSNDPVIEELAVKAAGRIKKNLTADTSINKNEDTGTENAENYIPANLNPNISQVFYYGFENQYIVLVSRFHSSTYCKICLRHKIAPTSHYILIFIASLRTLMKYSG